MKPSPTKLRKRPTHRARGVPIHWDEEQLRNLLAVQCDSADPDIRSLATEIDGRSRTATVDFQDMPASYQIALPDTPSRGSQPIRLDKDFLGITTLFKPPPQDHKVDIIAVCGLGGHAFGSFTERNGSHMWLRDALPLDVPQEADQKPFARVMIYGYESSLAQSESFQNLEDLATSFHTHLLGLVSTSLTKPIIIIGHSLGGLVVKQTLISLSTSTKLDDKTLLQAVYGLVFFGVPHDGMDIRSLIPMAGDGPNRFLLESLERTNSQILTIQQREFPKAFGHKGRVFCFYETLKSPTALQVGGTWQMSGEPAVLVTKSSATRCVEAGSEHVCAVNRSHSEMVKFAPHDEEYKKSVARIGELARRAVVAHPERAESKQIITYLTYLCSLDNCTDRLQSHYVLNSPWKHRIA